MNILIVDFLKIDCYVIVVFCNCNLKFWIFCFIYVFVSYRCLYGYVCYLYKYIFKF